MRASGCVVTGGGQNRRENPEEIRDEPEIADVAADSQAFSGQFSRSRELAAACRGEREAEERHADPLAISRAPRERKTLRADALGELKLRLERVDR